MQYSYRRYQPGDELAINELYYMITGHSRTAEQYAWQWLHSPAGESEIWLIEAAKDDGEKILIGHHGVMALEFTYKGKFVRVGKTENTMVLPEYREKILYPRYEKKFLSQYEHKFHALFSTIGPAAAIRLRKAMGYTAEYSWEKIYLGREPVISLVVIYEILTRRLGMHHSPSIAPFPEKERIMGTNIEAYIDNEASKNFDFDAFWEEACLKYPLTPARTEKNLSWRFWNNPYRSNITLILNNELLGTGVCILSFRKKYCASVEDIYCDDPDSLPRLLEIAHAWAKNFFGVFVTELTTTSDDLKYFNLKAKENEKMIDIYMRKKGREKRLMPRKITEVGVKSEMLSKETWFVTPFYFEGR